MKISTALEIAAAAVGLALACWLITILIPSSMVEAGVDYSVVYLARGLALILAVSALAPFAAVNWPFSSRDEIIPS